MKGDASCLNSDTTTGCYVTSEVLAQILVAEELFKTRTTEKMGKASERMEKKNDGIIKQRQLATELITAATTLGAEKVVSKAFSCGVQVLADMPNTDTNPHQEIRLIERVGILGLQP